MLISEDTTIWHSSRWSIECEECGAIAHGLTYGEAGRYHISHPKECKATRIMQG